MNKILQKNKPIGIHPLLCRIVCPEAKFRNGLMMRYKRPGIDCNLLTLLNDFFPVSIHSSMDAIETRFTLT